MTKTIMVTGGAGYIGSHTALELLDNGWKVIIVDNLSTGNRKLVPEQAIFYHVDINDSQAITDIIKKHSINAIMHFAGSVIVSESVGNPLKYYYNNTINSFKLIDIAKQTGIAFVDLNSLTADKYDALGQEKVAPFFPKEHTHTGKEGAEINAASVVSGIKALKDCLLITFVK